MPDPKHDELDVVDEDVALLVPDHDGIPDVDEAGVPADPPGAGDADEDGPLP